eukprot:GHVQ01025198.1.p2 GENE.GHVQ01025198.1~~GHVQ01025198.1.p2  ORF type:complete len:107 (+),score=12.06 GHVQ01025198.1:105-425(+)
MSVGLFSVLLKLNSLVYLIYFLACFFSGDWVRTELSVRVAHRLYDFHRLPFAVLGNPYIRDTYDVYTHTFEKMSKVKPIKTMQDQQQLVKYCIHTEEGCWMEDNLA